MLPFLTRLCRNIAGQDGRENLIKSPSRLQLILVYYLIVEYNTILKIGDDIDKYVYGVVVFFFK